MKVRKSSISRRSFMRRMATGAMSVSILNSCDWEDDDFEEIEQPENSLPKFFDCNKYIGAGFPDKPDYPGITDLLADMDRLGIDRAVVWHTAARDPYPMSGNEQLLQEIINAGAQDRIIPSFNVAPSIKNSSAVMDQLLEHVKTNQIRAFHFFPKELGWPTLQDIVPIFRSIRSYNPVLFLNCFQSLGNPESILNFSNELPEVSIVLTNAIHSHYSKIYELLGARSNIFVDTSFLHTYRIIEYLISRYGKERLVFGTGYKSNNGASIAALAHSDISSENTRLIAHGNLEKLLGIKTPLKGYNPVNGDRYWHKLLRKEKIGPEIYDAHVHISRRIMQQWIDYDKTDLPAHIGHALKYMDSVGVNALFVAEYTFYSPDTLIGKTYLEENLSPYGDRFRGYLSALAFTPDYKDKMIPRLDEIFSRPYYIGFKMHNDNWKIPLTDPCFIPMWEYADLHNLPILLHTWNTDMNAPKMLQEIVPGYPNAQFLLGHAGNTDRPDAIQLALENPNVYLEWCGSFIDPADWRDAINVLGNDRILYGSDAISWEPMWGHNPIWELGRLLSLDVPDETLTPILGANMSNILAKRK